MCIDSLVDNWKHKCYIETTLDNALVSMPATMLKILF